MAHFTSLPPELLIHVLSFLPLPSLISIPRLSKQLKSFFEEDQNATVIWRNVCVLHGLIGFSKPIAEGKTSDSTSEPPRREWGRWSEWLQNGGNDGAVASDVRWSDVAALYSEQSLGHANDWKGLGAYSDTYNLRRNSSDTVKRRVEIHRSWSGELHSDVKRYAAEQALFAPNSRSHMATLQRAMLAAKKYQLEGEKDAHSVPAPRILTDSDDEAEFYLPESPSSSPSRSSDEQEPHDVDLQIRQAKLALGINPAYPFRRDVEMALLRLGKKVLRETTGPFLELAESFIPSGANVHRIKVDERSGFVITTTRNGGLVVRDIETGEMLWCLPAVRVFDHK